jgi:gamma-glutamylcyclotransferase (GGCT)/AIG2-like uncharacterized protein YtfP
MTILGAGQEPGHIAQSLDHVNEALDAIEQNRSKTYVAERLFDGLNKLQTEWMINQTDQELHEVRALIGMIIDGIPSDVRNELFQCQELKALIDLQPPIMNHYTLRRRQYRPGVDISSALLKQATAEHRKMASAFRKWEGDRSKKEATRALKWLAELLYIVRSNIKHGEKTPYGPDREKVGRDESVCAIVVPILVMVIEVLLGAPSTKLVVYGSLAPGEANHEVLAGITGDWEKCFIRGAITESNGLRRLHRTPASDEVTVHLFASKELPLLWQRLDSFEGASYKRRLIPARTVLNMQVANVYVAR